MPAAARRIDRAAPIHPSSQRREVMLGHLGSGMLGVFALGLLAAAPLCLADDMVAARTLTVTQCSQCHTFDKGQKHGQGPNLYGLIGREAASVPGFVFSDGMKEALKGKRWDAILLDAWLTDTIAVAPKAQMVYFQDDPEVRAMLIMFLSSLHD
jgi:cytochrome c